MDNKRIIWEPQPKQIEFMQRFEDEALYGGAAGGGKSDALVMEATRQVRIPYYKGIIFRRTFPQLKELLDKASLYYPRAFPGCKYNASTHTWHFPSGAQIIYGSMKDEASKYNHQGIAYDFIGFDELTHFTQTQYEYLRSRNRPNGPGTRCYMRSTCNPGGVGHGWVKAMWIDAGEPMKTMWEVVDIVHPDGHTEKQRKSKIFVPSSVFDNEILMRNDPGYVARLASMDEATRNALLYGDWNSFQGQVFREWRNDSSHYLDRQWTHVIEPFEIPSHWQIYRSYDHGYAKPFSVGWYAYDGEAFYRILEMYGCTQTPNTGVEWTTTKIFSEIHRVETEHEWLAGKHIIGIADPAIWQEDGGDSIAKTAADCGVYFTKADNTRIAGLMQCHRRLAFNDDGFPLFYVFKNCKHFIRTIPPLVYSETNVEDVETTLEDHIYDEWRYCMQAVKLPPKQNKQVDPYRMSPQYLILDIAKEDLTPARHRQRMEIIND